MGGYLGSSWLGPSPIHVVHSWTSGKVRSVASYLEASLVRGGSQTVGLAAPREILTTNSSQDQDTQLSRGADVL